jgi:DNA topoisomerase-3
VLVPPPTPSEQGVTKQTRGKGRKGIARSHPAPGPSAEPQGQSRTHGTSDAAAAGRLFEALKRWRLAEARKRSIPAFRIFSDRVLAAIAAQAPTDPQALLNVKGVGPKSVKTYGGAVLTLTADDSTGESLS